ncbi:cold-shock protein [Paenibacillus tarimensis]
MYNSRRKPQEDIPEEISTIWSCSNEKCNGWMRDNFTFSNLPKCPKCLSVMTKGEKMISVLVNTSPIQIKQ